jgi:peptidyl-prolyl cis-trans isomerase SurA
MRRFRYTCVLMVLCLFLTLKVSPYLSAEVINGIACKVGSAIITVNEFNTAYDQLRAQARMFGVPVPGKREVLDGLIDNLLILQEAEKRGVVVSKSELNDIIQEIKTQNNFTDEEFELQLRQEGLTIEELQEQYRNEIIRTRLTNYFVTASDFNLSEQEIRDFYDDPRNKRLFRTPAILGISQIYIPVNADLSFQEAVQRKEQARMIAEEAAGKDNFEELVMQYSAAANKEQNRGNLGSFTQEQLLSIMSPQDVGLLFSLDPGEVTPPIRMKDGYYIFRINEKTESKQLTYEESRERLKSYLLKMKGEERLREWLEDERAATRIQIVMNME